MQFDTRSLWIYLHFPQLQLNLLEANNSSDAIACTLPRAIVDTATNRLCQVNAAAIQHGLALNSGLASASILCSELQLHEYDPDIETQHIKNIANYLYLFTSDIVLLAPKALALRAQNMLSLYGGLQGYWQVITQALATQNIDYIAASAYSVQAAKILALNSIELLSDNHKNISTALKRCALKYSDIDPKDTHKLSRIGINTYADLLSLPLDEVANRVSRSSMAVINELQGKQAAKLVFYQPQAKYSEYLELLYEITNSDRLLPIIHLMLKKLSSFLLMRNAHCLQISISFIQREHPSLEHAFNSIRAIYKDQEWLEIIQLKLESIKFESPVYALTLNCQQYEVAEVANDDMFAHKSSHVAALNLLSRLQSKLGEQQVSRLCFAPDHRPEHNTCLAKLSQKTNKNSCSYIVFADRPGLLLPQPEPLNLQLEVINGPERIQTGWWDDQAINRDYFIAQHKNGQQLWIFRTPEQEWFIHGFFI